MKILKSFFVLTLLITMSITLNALKPEEEYSLHKNIDDNNDANPDSISLRGASRFLAQISRTAVTCNKYPRVCRVKGSPGPDCCKKKCVNVKTDRLNCGKCGKKCKYSEICCNGKCLNPMSNKSHCGGCNNRCKKGSTCAYGICSYAN